MLYRVIDEHLEAFLETAQRHADGAALPAFVEQLPDMRRAGARVRAPVPGRSPQDPNRIVGSYNSWR